MKSFKIFPAYRIVNTKRVGFVQVSFNAGKKTDPINFPEKIKFQLRGILNHKSAKFYEISPKETREN